MIEGELSVWSHERIVSQDGRSSLGEGVKKIKKKDSHLLMKKLQKKAFRFSDLKLDDLEEGAVGSLECSISVS